MIFSFILLGTTKLVAVDELKRVDSMVQGISLLRKSYEALIMQEKEKNLLLQKQLQICQKKGETNQVIVEKRVLIPVNICQDNNKFPKLKLKK